MMLSASLVANALLMAVLWGSTAAILSDIQTKDPGRPCSVHGRNGVCMYSMVCTFAKGTHLGTCRDRFIFGSCCKLPEPEVEAVVAESESNELWEEEVNNLPLDQVCGRRHEDDAEQKARIQGGEIANRTSWPWQAGLRLKYGGGATVHHCGAVLLNHHWVATAAHCVYKKNMAKLGIVLGDYNNGQEDIDPGQIMRNVAEVLIHPQYLNKNYDNDLALLRLDSPVVYSKYILPICLPTKDLQIIGKRGYVTGWGRIYDGGPEPSLLNQVDVPILSNSECNNLFKLAALDEHVSEDIWVCAGYREGGKDACDGDSGGPLSVAEGEGASTVWSLGGIISWGPNSCGEKYRPGVYTRVVNFVRWIKEKIMVHKYEWSKYRNNRV